MDDTEGLMHRLGEVFAAGLAQPGSLREVVTANSRQGQTFDAAGNRALIGRWGNDLADLVTQIRVREGIQTLTFEVSVDESGEYMVALSGDLPTKTGVIASEPRVVFDSVYRYPNHPPPGMAKPAGALNDGRPTDPAVLAEVQALIGEFSDLHTCLNGEPPGFRPGYLEAEVLDAERKLGVRLPEDLRALYLTIHDDSAESGLLAGYSVAPLDQVVTWYHQGDPGSYGWNDGLFELDPVVFETAPSGHVRRVSRSDWWITFAPDYGMNYAVVDLDPGPSGNYGQVLRFGRDVYGPIQHVAPSIRHLMRTATAAMRDATPGEDDEASANHDSERYDWRIDVGQNSIASLISNVDVEAIQLAHLRDVEQVHLADLAGLPNLRTIRVLDARKKATYVNLSLPAGAPVEHVHVEAERFEPQRLVATPTLSYLTLAGNVEPAEVAALAGLPHLVKLDIAGASIADIASLATFSTLRVLTLNSRQWAELLSTGWQPAALAAVELGGRPSIAESATWLAAIQGPGHPTAGHRTVRGHCQSLPSASKPR